MVGPRIEDRHDQDVLRVCEGCGQFRHVNWFSVGRKFCHECREGQSWRLTEALRSGAASEEEILSHATSPDVQIPGGLLVYTQYDDTPSPTTRELNNELAERHLTALTYAKETRKLTHEEYLSALTPLTEDPEWVAAYEAFDRETPDPRQDATTSISVGLPGRSPRSRLRQKAADSPSRGTPEKPGKVGE